MKRKCTFLFGFMLSASLAFAQSYAPVQAIFNTYCTGCHGAGFQGLNLTSEANVLASVGTDCGQTIVPGDADASPLMTKIDPALANCDGQNLMPNGGPPLSAADIATVRAWINGLVTLSVEFVSFTTNVNERGFVDVAFSVERQSNSDYFEIQRSENGIDFETIAVLEPQSNQGIQNYYFMDSETLLSGQYYYRAVEVDMSSERTISPVGAVRLEKNLSYSLSVYPNPAGPTDRLFLPPNTYGDLQIFNDKGQVIYQMKLDKAISQNEIPMSALGFGVYYCRLVNELGVFTEKLILSN